MTDGGQDFDLGQVVGSAGEKGDDGSTLWNTSTAPTYANSKYTFNISNLSGKTGLQIAVNDIIFYSTYYYIVSNVNSTTVDCSTRVSIKGSGASVTIVDNLNSDSSTSVLSAKQGKVLNTNKIETSAIATSFSSTTSDSKVPSEKLTKNTLDNKVDKVTGKGLSTNDFTNSYKNTIDGLSTVATTGDYDDLTDKPSIPSSSSDLSDGSNIVKKSSTSGLLKNDGTVMASGTGSSNWAVGNHTHGRIASNGQVVNGSNQPIGAKILFTDSNSQLTGSTHLFASAVNDNAAHGNLGTSAGATQTDINSAIDSIIGSAISYIVGSGS